MPDQTDPAPPATPPDERADMRARQLALLRHMQAGTLAVFDAVVASTTPPAPDSEPPRLSFPCPDPAQAVVRLSRALREMMTHEQRLVENRPPPRVIRPRQSLAWPGMQNARGILHDLATTCEPDIVQRAALRRAIDDALEIEAAADPGGHQPLARVMEAVLDAAGIPLPENRREFLETVIEAAGLDPPPRP